MDDLELDELTSMVLDCADLIPRGRVATYGDVAVAVGTGPRQVGRIMSAHGHLSNWWRVVRADGGSQVAERCRQFWEAEGISYSQGTYLKVCMPQHRIDGEELHKIIEGLSSAAPQPGCSGAVGVQEQGSP